MTRSNGVREPIPMIGSRPRSVPRSPLPGRSVRGFGRRNAGRGGPGTSKGLTGTDTVGRFHRTCAGPAVPGAYQRRRDVAGGLVRGPRRGLGRRVAGAVERNSFRFPPASRANPSSDATQKRNEFRSDQECGSMRRSSTTPPARRHFRVCSEFDLQPASAIIATGTGAAPPARLESVFRNRLSSRGTIRDALEGFRGDSSR